jgi:predicted lipoprotein with Yx(FWY)xxD motif
MWTKITALACAAVLLSSCGSRGDAGSAAAGGDPTAASSSATDVSVVVPSTTSLAAPSTSRAPDPAAAAGPGAVITLASSQFGPVLFDGSGQAIYLFDAETTSTPACYGECASAWPPVLTTDRPVAQGGVQAQLLGVTTRRGGATQVTYNGKPLYYYAHEGKNVVLCHNVREFGGLWLAITKTGSPAPT